MVEKEEPKKERIWKKLKEDFKKVIIKLITGRQDSKTRKIIICIIVLIITHLLVGIFGFYLNRALTPVSINAVISPYVTDNYIPIRITNGPKELKNVNLKIKTCFMDNYETFHFDKLIESEPRIQPLRDKETVFALSEVYNNPKFDCNSKNISSSAQCWIQTYVVDGKLYAPQQQCKKYQCGYCDYSLIIYSDSGKIYLNQSDKFPPLNVIKYNLKVSPLREIQDFESKNKTSFDAIGLSFFTPYEQCVLEGYADCDWLTKDTSSYLPKGRNFTFTISPTDKSLGNLTLIVTSLN